MKIYGVCRQCGILIANSLSSRMPISNELLGQKSDSKNCGGSWAAWVEVEQKAYRIQATNQRNNSVAVYFKYSNIYHKKP